MMNQDSHMLDHHDNGAKLIRMAREIADYFQAYPEDRAVDGVASHINKYWTPKMREEFLAAADEPGQTLPPLLQAARTRIKRKKTT
ncbi:formate dehydrogenase subunit delta [Rhodoblastus sp.]|jgi:formate dehydrogenase subunit delta|uniref:formate dehydrogenase subunit delta n=1 Tax=Rhodoblastus sp. TaxID=1962975 RepID=UPI002632A9C8|nr:formate dehydrogenase subunit delta [Rhodoblastus sp.]